MKNKKVNKQLENSGLKAIAGGARGIKMPEPEHIPKGYFYNHDIGKLTELNKENSKFTKFKKNMKKAGDFLEGVGNLYMLVMPK